VTTGFSLDILPEMRIQQQKVKWKRNPGQNSCKHAAYDHPFLATTLLHIFVQAFL
jgi:hypothetical protein